MGMHTYARRYKYERILYGVVQVEQVVQSEAFRALTLHHPCTTDQDP
jgi:hypothetical protein